MSTLVAVKKKGIACIAADTMTSFGSRKQRAAYVAHPEKIQRVSDSYIGIVGSAAHDLVVKSIFSQADNLPNFQNRLEIFEFFRKLHTQLKKEYFLNPKEDEDDPYESSQMDMFIANRYGIFSVYSLREVYEYQKFWAIGAGSDYAIGAMYAAYEHFDSAEAIARIGVEAGIEFDDGTAGPINSYCVDLIEEKPD
jgi:ATP-dependent protease HslVU (ClpYQ) peptidase subunit